MSLPTPTLPSADSAFTLTSGGFTCVLPNFVDSDTESRTGTAYIESLYGLNGGIRARSLNFDPITLNLSGYIFTSAKAQEFKRVVSQGTLTVTRDSKTLAGDVIEYSIKEDVSSSVWPFTLSVQSPQWYWLSTQETSGSNPSTITNDGDVTIFPIINFTGGSGGATVCSVTINSATATFTGSLGNGQVLSIDCSKCSATVNGANVLNSMNDSFFTNPPFLLPGSNAITLSVTGTATAVVLHTEGYL